ncbi:hypothetical protein SARC_05077 [Sphaeroforma arctica JP610]|uniref:Uncharacterized protein n=1 Tax=Sphaeroforma arctica JP610 TaxID=667725 RepID=A0A0L0G0K6_9EUKA|nr:hypothetical protein SARC_05077 [Sphaeroforma arctica JP610]KNC82637.1 hypothetical protein SARC_05077 [Sphaeroforma arctica JP610]|eukprot:XP_014156539.1 hypothetical protein SARC_05077 [Sphaeroforma arctica JP610]
MKDGKDDDSGKSSMTVAEYVAEALATAGVELVFGGHGGAVIALVNAIERHPKLTWVCMKNENNASLAAAAQAKLTGRLSCCLATSGPGATNLTTGLVAAVKDGVRVICITGMKHSWKVGYADFQDCNQTEIFRAGGVDNSYTILHKNSVVPLMRNSIACAYEKYTAVHVAIPVDIQTQELITLKPGETARAVFQEIHRFTSILPASTRYQRTKVVPSSHSLDVASESIVNKEALRGGRRRIIIAVGSLAVGTGVHVLRLAEALNAPVVAKLDGKGIVDESHPLYLGVLGIFGNPGLEAAKTIVQTSDLVVNVGVNECTELLAGSDGLQRRAMISIMPSANAASKNIGWQTEHDLYGNICGICEELCGRIDTLMAKHPEAANTWDDGSQHYTRKSKRDKNDPKSQKAWDYFLSGSWRQRQDGDTPADAVKSTGKQLRARDSTARFSIVEESASSYCHPMSVFAALGDLLSAEDIVAVDTGDSTLWSSLGLCLTKGQRVLADLSLGTMGYSLCAGVAASLTHPTAKVVVIVGDGALQMTVGELGMVAQNNVQSLIVIVVNNGVLGRVHFGFDQVLGDKVSNPDFMLLAKAYHGDGARITNEGEILPVLTQAMHSKGLFIVEVVEDPDLAAPMATLVPDVNYFDHERAECDE